MQCPKCGKEATGDVCTACGAYLTEETPRWYAEGIVHLAGEKQFSMAQELLQEGLQRYPTSSMLWFNAGVLAEMLKNRKDAAAYYQKAYQLKPTSEKYRQSLERVLGRPVPRVAPPPQAPAPAAPPPAPIEPAVSAPVEVVTPAAPEDTAPAAAKPEPLSSFAALEAQLTVLSDQLSTEQPAVEETPASLPPVEEETTTEDVAYTPGPEPMRLDTTDEAEPAIPITLDLTPAVSVAEPEAPTAEEPTFNAPAAEEPIFRMDDWLAGPAQDADEQPEPAPLELATVAEEPAPEMTSLTLEPVEEAESPAENIYVLPAEAEDAPIEVMQPTEASAEDESVPEAADNSWLWSLGTDEPAASEPETVTPVEAPDAGLAAVQDDTWTGAMPDLPDTEEPAPIIVEPEVITTVPEAEAAPAEIVETTEDIPAEPLGLTPAEDIPETAVAEEAETLSQPIEEAEPLSQPAEEVVESAVSAAGEQAEEETDTTVPPVEEIETMTLPADEEAESLPISTDDVQDIIPDPTEEAPEIIPLPEEDVPVIVEIEPHIDEAVPDEPAVSLTNEEAPVEPGEVAMEPESQRDELPETVEPVEPDHPAEEQDLMPIAIIADDDSEPSVFASADEPAESVADAADLAMPGEPLPELSQQPVEMPACNTSVIWPGWRLVRLLSGPLAVLAGIVLVVFFFAGKGTLFLILLVVFTALVLLRFISNALSDHDPTVRRR